MKFPFSDTPLDMYGGVFLLSSLFYIVERTGTSPPPAFRLQWT